jgi:hypothetical protein
MSDEPVVEVIPSETSQEIKLHAEAIKKLEVEDPGEMIVVASNPKQMQEAQAKLITHFKQKTAKLKVEWDEAEKNVELARTRKWKVAPFERLLTKAKRDVEFYEKITAALEAGFVIIPNLEELDIFAIRTTRKTPRANKAHGGENWVQAPDEQVSNRPALGEGRYVNADTINKEMTVTKQLKDGNVMKQRVAIAKEFDDVDFPFHFVKPEILEKTSQAMNLLAFDDIGILPNRRVRKGDPMVVGRITTKQGNNTKAVSFLITWWVNTQDI